MVAGRVVDVDPVATDRYGRTVGMVLVDGTNVNGELVRTGYAWVYRKYCKKSICSTWKDYEARARRDNIDMWQDPHIVPPWNWRHSRSGK